MQLNKLEDFEYVDKENNKKTLGEGAFSTVKLVRLKQNNKLYAMKEIDLTKINKDHVGNLKEEIKVHQSLKHPNIIRFEDCFQDGTMVYIQLEYAENGSLFFYIDPDNGLDEKLAFKFFYQTAMAFEYVHSKGIMHRDLKPENILLTKNFDIKLCDFGWAKIFKDSSEDNVICGTFEYMPPEIVFEQSHTYKVDVWALGILLYELLHGHPPFKANSLDEIRACFRNKVAQHFEERTSNEARSLLVQLLQIDPEKRISLEKVFYHPFFQKHINSYENDEYKDIPSPVKASPGAKSKRKATNHSMMSQSMVTTSENNFDDVSSVLKPEDMNFKKKTDISSINESDANIEQNVLKEDEKANKDKEREIIKQAILEQKIDPSTVKSASLVYTKNNTYQVKLQMKEEKATPDEENTITRKSNPATKTQVTDSKTIEEKEELRRPGTSPVKEQVQRNINHNLNNTPIFDHNVSPIENKSINETNFSSEKKNPLIQRVISPYNEAQKVYRTVSQNINSTDNNRNKNYTDELVMTSPKLANQPMEVRTPIYVQNVSKDANARSANNMVSAFSSPDTTEFKSQHKKTEQKFNTENSERQSEQSASDNRTKLSHPNRRVISKIEDNGKTVIKFPEEVERKVYYQKSNEIQSRSRSRSQSEHKVDKKNENLFIKKTDLVPENIIKEEMNPLQTKVNKDKKIEAKQTGSIPARQNIIQLRDTPKGGLQDKPDALTTNQVNLNYPIKHHQPVPLTNAKTIDLTNSTNQLLLNDINQDTHRINKYQSREEFTNKISQEGRKVLEMNEIKNNDVKNHFKKNSINVNNTQNTEKLTHLNVESKNTQNVSNDKEKSPGLKGPNHSRNFDNAKKVIDQESVNILKLKENLNSFNNKLIKQNEIISEYESRLTRISDEDRSKFDHPSMEKIYDNAEKTNTGPANKMVQIKNNLNTQIMLNNPVTNDNLLKDISETIEKSQNYREKYKERQVNFTPREKNSDREIPNFTGSDATMHKTVESTSGNYIRRMPMISEKDNIGNNLYKNTIDDGVRTSDNIKRTAGYNIDKKTGKIVDKKTFNNRYDDHSFSKDYDNKINESSSVEIGKHSHYTHKDIKKNDNKERMMSYAKGYIDIKENFDIDDKNNNHMTTDNYQNTRNSNDLIYKKYPELFFKHFKADTVNNNEFFEKGVDERRRYSEKPSVYYNKNSHINIRRKSSDIDKYENSKPNNNSELQNYLNNNNPLYMKYMNEHLNKGKAISSLSTIPEKNTSNNYEITSDPKEADDIEQRFYRRQNNYLKDNEKNSSGAALRLYRSKSPINVSLSDHNNLQLFTSASKDKTYLKKDDSLNKYDNFKKDGKGEGKVVYSRKISKPLLIDEEKKETDVMKNLKEREINNQNKHIQTEKKKVTDMPSNFF